MTYATITIVLLFANLVMRIMTIIYKIEYKTLLPKRVTIKRKGE